MSVTVTRLTVWRGRVHRARRKFDSVPVPCLCLTANARPLVPSAHTCEGQPCPGPCVAALVDGRAGVRSQLLRRPGASDALCSSDATPPRRITDASRMSGPGVLHLWIPFHRWNVVVLLACLGRELFFVLTCAGEGGEARPASAAAFRPPRLRLGRRSETTETPGPPGSGALASGGGTGFTLPCEPTAERGTRCASTRTAWPLTTATEKVWADGHVPRGAGWTGPWPWRTVLRHDSLCKPQARPAGFAGPWQTWKALSSLPLRKGQEGALPEGPDSDRSEAYEV